jgi:hypothetical protein
MPGFDRTGPMGAGPMTGGARGRCNPSNVGYDLRFTAGGNMGRGLRRGFRGGNAPGRNRGFGRGYGWYPPVDDPFFQPDTNGEIEMLKAQAGYMKSSLDTIHKRIDELEKKPPAES